MDNNLLNPKSQLLLQGEELIFTNYPFSSLLAVQICYKSEVEMIKAPTYTLILLIQIKLQHNFYLIILSARWGIYQIE